MTIRFCSSSSCSHRHVPRIGMSMKLLTEFQHYFNGYRTHAGLGGGLPQPGADTPPSPIDIQSYKWRRHCRGLYHTPESPHHLMNSPSTGSQEQRQAAFSESVLLETGLYRSFRQAVRASARNFSGARHQCRAVYYRRAESEEPKIVFREARRESIRICNISYFI